MIEIKVKENRQLELVLLENKRITNEEYIELVYNIKVKLREICTIKSDHCYYSTQLVKSNYIIDLLDKYDYVDSPLVKALECTSTARGYSNVLVRSELSLFDYAFIKISENICTIFTVEYI